MRNKFIYSTLVAGMLIGTSACTGRAFEDVVATEQGEQTNMSIRLTLQTPDKGLSRAATTGTGSGQAPEKNVNTITLFVRSSRIDFTKIPEKPVANPSDKQFWQATGGVSYETSVWTVKQLATEMALLVNSRKNNTELKDLIGRTPIGVPTGNEIVGTAGNVAAYATQAVNDIAQAAVTSNGGDLLMTSEVKSVQLTPGVSSEEAWNNASSNNNRVNLDVERIVAKGVLYHQNTTDTFNVQSPVPQATKLGVVLTGDMKFAVVNSAMTTYLFRRKDVNGEYATQSAIHDNGYANTAEEAKTKQLLRLGNLGTTVDALGGYKPQIVSRLSNASPSTNDLSQLNGIYFFENTSSDYGLDAARYGYNRYATAKAYVTFKPAELYKLDTTMVDGVQNVVLTVVDKTAPREAPQTFYFSTENARCYATIDAAVYDGQRRSDLYTYTNGRMAYRTLWKRTNREGTTILADAGTRRNTVYALMVNSFVGMGMPWDPADPADPNLPKPDDDSDKSDGPGMDPNVNKIDSYMRVKASVVPWTVVKRQSGLGNIY